MLWRAPICLADIFTWLMQRGPYKSVFEVQSSSHLSSTIYFFWYMRQNVPCCNSCLSLFRDQIQIYLNHVMCRPLCNMLVLGVFEDIPNNAFVCPAASRAVESYIVYDTIFDFSQSTPKSSDHGRMSAGILSLVETCDKLLPCSGLCLSSQTALSPPPRSQRLGFEWCCKSILFLFPKSTNHLTMFLASAAPAKTVAAPTYASHHNHQKRQHMFCVSSLRLQNMSLPICGISNILSFSYIIYISKIWVLCSKILSRTPGLFCAQNRSSMFVTASRNTNIWHPWLYSYLAGSLRLWNTWLRLLKTAYFLYRVLRWPKV